MAVSKIIGGLRRFISGNQGVTAVEYGVLGALIIVVCLVAIGTVGTGLQAYFQAIAAATI